MSAIWCNCYISKELCFYFLCVFLCVFSFFYFKQELFLKNGMQNCEVFVNAIHIVCSLCGDCNKFPNQKISLCFCLLNGSLSIYLQKGFVIEVVRGQARCEKSTHLAGLNTSLIYCLYMFKTTVHNLCVSRAIYNQHMNLTYWLLPYCCSWK